MKNFIKSSAVIFLFLGIITIMNSCDKAKDATLPDLTTVVISGTTQTTAVSGGSITAENGGTISARGVCWSTSTNPTIADSKTLDGTGKGTFVSNLTGLIPGTLYYVKAYATNSAGTAYGNELTFTESEIALASLSTAVVTEIAAATAVSGGDITDDNGGDITDKGVCWSTTADPTVADSHTSDGTGVGVFISNLTGLTTATLYYVRAYSTNSAGTSYGDQVTFTTL
jgi:hypothetical protein